MAKRIRIPLLHSNLNFFYFKNNSTEPKKHEKPLVSRGPASCVPRPKPALWRGHSRLRSPLQAHVEDSGRARD